VEIEAFEVDKSDLLLQDEWMEAIADRLSSEEGVNVLLIHSAITSRLVSSRELLYIVQDDHDRAITARISHRFCGA